MIEKADVPAFRFRIPPDAHGDAAHVGIVERDGPVLVKDRAPVDRSGRRVPDDLRRVQVGSRVRHFGFDIYIYI
jgi:hypothetical protein